MKKTLFIFFAFVMSGIVYSQAKFNQFSLEGGIGVSSPLINADPYNNKGASGKPHLIGAARYMFTQLWGIRGSMAYDSFKLADDQGTRTLRFDTQAVLNAGRLFDLPEVTNYRVGLLMHGGAGITFLTAYQPAGTKDKMVSLVGGITPIFRISNGMSLFVDGSVTMDMMRNVYYNGTIARGSGSIKSLHGTLAVGLIIPIGKRDHHADWY